MGDILSEKRDFLDTIAIYVVIGLIGIGCYLYYFLIQQGMPITIF